MTRWCCGRLAAIKRPTCQIIILYILVFGVILPPICYRLPFSVYYSPKLFLRDVSPGVYARRVNDERVAKAEEFFASESTLLTLPHNNLLLNSSKYSNGNRVNITIAFLTTRRTRPLGPTVEYSPRYLLQTVAAVQREYLPNTRIIICNMDPTPSSHTDAVYLSAFFPMVSRYGDDSASVPTNKLEKEKQDHVFCLKKSLETDPRYVLLLQDDALAVPGSLKVLDYIIRTKVERSRRGWNFASNNDTKKIIKLFTPEYIQRDFYTNKPKRIVANLAELLGYGLLGGTLLRLLHIIMLEKGQNRVLLNGIFVSGAVCCILAALAISRPHLLELRRISKYLYIMLDANDCCLPATLLPSAAAGELATFLDGVTCRPGYPLDTAVDGFVKSRGYRQFAVEPNLFLHIGMYSTLHRGENTYLKHFVK